MSLHPKIAAFLAAASDAPVPASVQDEHALPALVFAHGGFWCLGSLDV